MTATMEPNGDITAEFEAAREAALTETTTHQAHIGRLEAMERNGLVYGRWVARLGSAVFVGLVVACVVVAILLVADAASATTAVPADTAKLGDWVGVSVVIGIGLFGLMGARSMFGKPPEEKRATDGIMGLLMLGLLALALFGVGWEVLECVTQQEFGDPGDGSNPFTKACPFDKK